MASRIPIVLTSGELKQLQSGDTIDATVLTNGTLDFTKANTGFVSAFLTSLGLTNNFIPKSNGSILVNSRISDDGSNLINIDSASKTCVIGDISNSGTLFTIDAAAQTITFDSKNSPGSGIFFLSLNPDLVDFNRVLAITPTGELIGLAGNLVIAAGKTFTISNDLGFAGEDGKVLTLDNSIELRGTDGSLLNIGSGGSLGSNAFNSTAYLPLTGGTLTGQIITAAGSTAANSAGIKLQSGALNTTAQAGAFEFLTDAFYLTITNGILKRKSIVLALAAGPINIAGTTAARTVTFPDVDFTAARKDAAQTFTGTQTFGTIVAGDATNPVQILAFSGQASWIDIPAVSGKASGIGSGGAGSNAWVGYAGSAGQWFLNSGAADLCYRNANGKKIHIGIDSSTPGNANAILTFSVSSVGLGTTSPSAFFHIIGTTEQLRIGYDTSNYYKTTVSSTGAVTFDAVGSGSSFTFNDTIINTVPLRLKNYTVATLPAGTQGDTAFVTDALAPTFLAIVVGGGAVVAPVFYNGTNWVGY